MSGSKPSAPPVVGIDVGGTNMQIGVLDASDAIIGRAAVRTGAEGGLERVLDNIEGGVEQACVSAGVDRETIGAVGVAAAGAIDIPRGIVLQAPNLGWARVPLRDLLEERLGRPVVVDNDVNGAVWGEYRLGAGPRHGDALGVWVGTGVGGGLVLGGRLHHGDLFTAGEIGHTILFPDGEPGRRTVEEHCSRTGVRSIVRERLAGHPGSIVHDLLDDDDDRLGTEDLVRAYRAGDALVVRVLDDAADLLGLAVANWVTALAVGTVIVGGGMTEALGEPWFRRIGESFRAHVFPPRSRDCRLVMTTLAADAGLLGAALIARERVGH